MSAAMRGRLTFAFALVGAAAQAGDATRGKQVFQACAACHAGAGAGEMGPNLTGVFGRKAAAREDFRYSPAMTRAGLVWDENNLKAFVRDPQQLVRGTRMPFAGMDDEKDIDDLVAYIATMK